MTYLEYVHTVPETQVVKPVQLIPPPVMIFVSRFLLDVIAKLRTLSPDGLLGESNRGRQQDQSDLHDEESSFGKHNEVQTFNTRMQKV